MADYGGFPKSDIVVTAFYEGLVPASKVGSGIPAALIKKHCRYAEWHHNSKQFNTSEFYDPEYVKGRFGIYGSGHEDFDDRAAAAFNAHKVACKAKYPGEVYKDCRVDWLEWSGSTRPHICSEQSADGCTVRVKEQTAYITFTDGTTMIKLLTTDGFSFTPNYTTYLKNIDEATREREKEEKQVFKERGARLSKTIKWEPSNSGKVMAAMTANGRTVLAMQERRHYYVHDELSKEGIVVSGYYNAAAGAFIISEHDIAKFPARIRKLS